MNHLHVYCENDRRIILRIIEENDGVYLHFETLFSGTEPITPRYFYRWVCRILKPLGNSDIRTNLPNNRLDYLFK